MNDRPNPPPTWQQRVAHPHPRRRHHHAFARGSVTLGAIHMGGMLAGILAADRMKDPSARWGAIAGFGVATGIGEAMWRERIEREREEEDRIRE
jgi:hypothetical protein